MRHGRGRMSFPAPEPARRRGSGSISSSESDEAPPAAEAAVEPPPRAMRVPSVRILRRGQSSGAVNTAGAIPSSAGSQGGRVSAGTGGPAAGGSASESLVADRVPPARDADAVAPCGEAEAEAAGGCQAGGAGRVEEGDGSGAAARSDAPPRRSGSGPMEAGEGAAGPGGDDCDGAWLVTVDDEVAVLSTDQPPPEIVGRWVPVAGCAATRKPYHARYVTVVVRNEIGMMPIVIELKEWRMVLAVKLHVYYATGYLLTHQRLSHNGERLDDYCQLDDYGWCNGQWVEIRVDFLVSL